MNSGKSTIFPCGGISVRIAAQRKGVSVSTIYRWIKSGKLFAKKIKGRYCIATDELFARAKKYQHREVNKELMRENLLLKKELRESQEACRELSIAYDKSLEKAENLQREVMEWRLYDLIERSPDLLMTLLREYRRRQGQRSTPPWEYHEYWECEEDGELELALLADTQGEVK